MFFEIEGITKSFGGLTANKDVTLSFEKGTINGLIGPNGAGKSTLFKTISGYITPNAGQIRLEGKVLSGMHPYRICKEGIACTFQDAKNFPELDVFETFLVGAYCKESSKKKACSRVEEMIEFFGLTGKEHMFISKLNMYERKLVAIGAAMSSAPKLLLLDELFAGCTPTEVIWLIEVLKKINKEYDVTLFIIEHVLKVIMSICQSVVVLENGKVLEIGTPEQIVKSPKVISAYLGEDYDASQC